MNFIAAVLVWSCLVAAWSVFVGFVLQPGVAWSFVLGMPAGLVALAIAGAVYNFLDHRTTYRRMR